MTIRFGQIQSYRFGHYIKNVELYLSEKKTNPNTSIDIFFLSSKSSNSYFEKMCKRKIKLYPFQILLTAFLIAKKIPFFKKNLINMRQYDIDKNNILDKVECQISFTFDEKEQGDFLLNQLGINKKDKIICIVSRDEEYAKKNLLGRYDLDNKWKVRNSDIQSYEHAAQKVSDLGYKVVRVGKDSEKNINFKNKNIIDYSKSKFRSDFLDIYLAYRCSFAVCDTAGWCNAPMAFRKYVAFVNWVPISELHYYSEKFTYISKHIYDLKQKKQLSLNEIIERKLHSFLLQESKNAEIKFIDNTPEEIAALVLEVESKFRGSNKYKINDSQLNSDFKNFLIKNNFLENNMYSIAHKIDLHKNIKFKSTFGELFLGQNFNSRN